MSYLASIPARISFCTADIWPFRPQINQIIVDVGVPRASRIFWHRPRAIDVIHRAGIGPKTTISLRKWQSGPSPKTPRGMGGAKNKIQKLFKHIQEEGPENF